jgi:hypothetical protein
MCSYRETRPDYRLIPFMLCEGNSINFFLASAADKKVINFIVEESDCYSSDLFTDSLSAAIDFMAMEKNYYIT